MYVKIIILVLVVVFSATELWALTNFCNDDQFLCANGKQCRQLSDVCNNRGDCSDGSDEFNCSWTGYTWCNFCNDLCGWDVQGFEKSAEKCGLKIAGFDTVKILTSSPMKTLSKHCSIQFNVTFSYRFCQNMSLSIQHLDNTKLISNDVCGSPYTKSIGYQKNNTKLIVKLLYDNPPYYQDNVINDIRFINCDPAIIPFDCDFRDNDICTWWFYSTRFNKWQYINDDVQNVAYISNKLDELAEIRSPLILATGDDGVCLVFKYRMIGGKNNLRVTKINIGSDNSEEVIWSYKVNTKDRVEDNWTKARLSIKSDVDFDIGFISSAIDGEVSLDDISLRKGSCKYKSDNLVIYSDM